MQRLISVVLFGNKATTKLQKNIVAVLGGQQCVFMQQRKGMSENTKLLGTFTLHPPVALLDKQRRSTELLYCTISLLYW
jgi:hypothetical protein